MSERYSDRLRTWVQIDLDAIMHNFALAKERLSPGMKLLAVIKANAYGHGARRIARLLEGTADYFAVAAPVEAVQLRKDGIKTPVMLLGPVPCGCFSELIENDITLAVSTFDEAEAISRCAGKLGKKAKIHIALDTGMTRIGFACSDTAAKEIARAAALPHLELEGVFSHFATADEADKTAALQQMRRFSEMLARLEGTGVRFPIRHLFNSAAIADFEPAFDMAREGITLYGLRPSDEVSPEFLSRLCPAMQLFTKITRVATVPEGTPVGYGGTFVTKKETRIATVCIGYADGYFRAVSGKGYMLIAGKRAPILGRICMDQTMLDVTDIPEAAVGMTVTAFGENGGETLTADQVAAWAGTIGYELVCAASPRLPRIYTQNGEVESVEEPML